MRRKPMKGIIMTKEIKTTSVHELFKQYNSITSEIALIEYQLQINNIWPSAATVELTELYLEQWRLRRMLNSAYESLEKAKPLWKRIFKK
jgi:hypothetical protein